MNAESLKLLYQRAIFSLITQETRDIKDSLINGNLLEKLDKEFEDDQIDLIMDAVKTARKQYYRKFEEDWANEEGTRHLKVFDLFFEYISEKAFLDPENFAFNRPTCGAREALVAITQEYSNRCRSKGKEAVFVTERNLDQEKIKSGEYNGTMILLNAGDDFNDIIDDIEKYSPDAEVVVDLSGYVPFGIGKIDLNRKCIKSVYFSLNDELGLEGDYMGFYLHNTMGLSKEQAANAFPVFFGHQWFINYNSVLEAEEILKELIAGNENPDVKAIKNHLWDGDLKEQLEATKAFTPEQIEGLIKTIHEVREEFFELREKRGLNSRAALDTWKGWTQDTVKIDGRFQHTYVTNGASEALRNVISEFGIKNHAPVVYTFAADYEGFKAYAYASHIPTKEFNRTNWREMVADIAKESETKQVKLCFTQPSSIDGKVWAEFDEFMTELSAKAPKVEVLLDVTYVGCSFKEFTVDTSYPIIKDVAFSLSKPAGMYYDRIGGLFSVNEYPHLSANDTALNPDSILFAKEYMEALSVREKALKYKQVHDTAAAEFNRHARVLSLGHPTEFKMPELAPSDVIGIASATQVSTIPSELEKYYTRGDGVVVRVNTTPAISVAISDDLAPRTAEMVKNMNAKTR